MGLLVLFLAMGSASSLAQEPAPPPAPHHPEHVLVRFKASASAAGIAGANVDAENAVPVRHFECVPRLNLMRVPPGMVARAIAAYRRNPNVLYAEPDYRVYASVTPNDPDFPLQWGMTNTGQAGGTAGSDIGAAEAWDIFTGAPLLKVAVIDTGVDYTHADLIDNIHLNPLEVPGNGIDDDDNGWIDDVHGYDFLNGDGDPMDDNSHGTHVAGILAARGNNGIGVTGVAWRCTIVPLKFLGADGSGLTSHAIGALDYVVAHEIRLSNNSWGGAPFQQAMFDAIAATQSFGHLFIAAAGNESQDNDFMPAYPASYALPNIIAVAATDSTDALADFTNVGLTSVDLAAPGVGTYSTVIAPNYGFLSGTSMAAPHVAGAAALLMGYAPRLTSIEVRDRLIASVRPVTALTPWLVTGGVLDVGAALADCNGNGTADTDDIQAGVSIDCTGNGIPDECEADCDGNGVADSCDILAGTHSDCDDNGILDDCDVDCDGNGLPDGCELANGTAENCDGNALIDRCEADFDGDGLINNCDDDSDDDGVADEIDVCPFSHVGGPTLPNGRPLGDITSDCLLTNEDFVSFHECLQVNVGGPGATPDRICRTAFDMDGSQEIDLRDYYIFQQVFTRP